MFRELEFTAEEIHAVWSATFGADVPEELSIKQVYEACLCELSPEVLRDELRKVRYE